MSIFIKRIKIIKDKKLKELSFNSRITWDWRHAFCHKACNILQQEILRQALRQFLRNQSRAQIPGTLYAIIIKHQQIRRIEKRRVGAPLTGMN